MTKTQQPELPALPKGVERVQIIAGHIGGFETEGWAVPFRCYYTKAQMQAYAQAAVLADRERRENPQQLIERWKGDDKIESPFNACMHRGYCLGLKEERERIRARILPLINTRMGAETIREHLQSLLASLPAAPSKVEGGNG